MKIIKPKVEVILCKEKVKGEFYEKSQIPG